MSKQREFVRIGRMKSTLWKLSKEYRKNVRYEKYGLRERVKA